MSQIYIDMDGVVADFDGYLEKKGWSAQSGEFWNEHAVNELPFLEFEPIDEGVEMALRLHTEGIPICFLTSTGGGQWHTEIAMQKLSWLKNHELAICNVAFCMNSAGKAQYAAPGRFLVDDRQKVIDHWLEAGGRGFTFTRDLAPTITSNLMKELVR